METDGGLISIHLSHCYTAEKMAPRSSLATGLPGPRELSPQIHEQAQDSSANSPLGPLMLWGKATAAESCVKW